MFVDGLGQYTTPSMLETSNASGWLLGDSGYGLRQYLMIPKLNPLTQAEEKYNMAHAKTRVSSI